MYMYICAFPPIRLLNFFSFMRRIFPDFLSVHGHHATDGEKACALYMMYDREYWMIYRWPGFLAVVWFGSSPTPFSPLPSESCLSLFLCLPICRRSSFPTGEGPERAGEEPDHTTTSKPGQWSCINHSILSDLKYSGCWEAYFSSTVSER